jgi:hypothetical protein
MTQLQNSMRAEIDAVKRENSELRAIVKRWDKQGGVVPDAVPVKAFQPNPDLKKPCVACKAKEGKFISLGALRTLRLSDPRQKDAKKVLEAVKKEGLYCNSCSTSSPSCKNPVSWANKHQYCLNCRAQRVTGAHHMCASCLPLKHTLFANHNSRKYFISTAFEALNKLFTPAITLDFEEEVNVWAKAGLPGQGQGQIDVVLNITHEKKKLLYVIELQRTAQESPSTLTHKYGQAILHYKPDRSFLMCVRLSEQGSLLIEHRIDILRRWVILTVLHWNLLPVWNHWWFFQDGVNPIKVDRGNGQEANPLSPFLSDPLKIDKAPRSPAISGASSSKAATNPWRYATDPLAALVPEKKGKRNDDRQEEKRQRLDEEEMEGDGEETESDNGLEDEGGKEERRRSKKDIFWYLDENEMNPCEKLGVGFPNAVGLKDYKALDVAENMYCGSECQECRRIWTAAKTMNP